MAGAFPIELRHPNRNPFIVTDARERCRTSSFFPPLPTLPSEVLEKVEGFERSAKRDLRECEGVIFNIEKAKRILRTCVIEVLDCQLAYYESLPTFQGEWNEEITKQTLDTAIGLLTGYVYRDEIYRDLYWTVLNHLKNRPGKQLEQPIPPDPVDRRKLYESYLNKFPGEEIKILDICWAAGQHYSEWKRWLRNAVKNGSAPDRALKAILTSGKRPEEYRKARRPQGWK